MSIYSLLSLSFALCAVYCCVILIFPETYKQTSSKKRINTLIGISILCYSVGLALLYFLRECNILSIQVDIKSALIIIPSITVFLFVANIFCPAFCIMLKHNKNETKIATQFNRLIFQYKYQGDKRIESIKELEEFQDANKKFLCEQGIELYSPERIKQSNNALHLAPEKLINMLEDCSIQLIKQTSDDTPNPFTNSNIVFSFGISTLLTLVLSYIAIIP